MGIALVGMVGGTTVAVISSTFSAGTGAAGSGCGSAIKKRALWLAPTQQCCVLVGSFLAATLEGD